MEKQRLISNFRFQIWDALFEKTKNQYGFLFEPCLQQPASVGNIRLKSANPFEHPLIDPRYLEEKRDVDILLEGTFHDITVCYCSCTKCI